MARGFYERDIGVACSSFPSYSLHFWHSVVETLWNLDNGVAKCFLEVFSEEEDFTNMSSGSVPVTQAV